MGASGPLEDLRVLDLTDGHGRYASKVLAELGGDVVRVAPSTESGPSLGPASGRGLLDWWYDTNCRLLPLDLRDGAGSAAFGRLVELADVFIDDSPPGALGELGLAPADLSEMNPRLVHVSLTPYGADGPRAAWRSSDLVAQAQAGHLSVTGDVDRPVVLWGRQSAVVGGLYTAVSALAGHLRAKATGQGTWVDLSLHEALVSCTEHLLMYWWFPEILAPLGAPIAGRQRSLHWVRAFEVVPCRRGACMVSPAAGGLIDLIAWLKERGQAQDVPAEPDEGALLALVAPLMDSLRAVALESDATDLFLAGQSLHVPFGESYNVTQVAECPQHRARGFLRPVADEPAVRLPGPVAHFSATPAPEPLAPATIASTDEVAERWDRRQSGPTAGADRRPLDGVRVLDFTHVLAGPFATRLLADLGAHVIRIQTEERSAGAADNAFPYNVMWARNKRSIQLAMKHEGALDVLRPLVEQADIVIDNFSVGVMDSWGAGPAQLAEWNPEIITLSMSGCGGDGPWRNFVTYAPTVHALCGLTALTGPKGETDCGPGVAYNDHVSGLTGALALLSALLARGESGRGQHIEISQLEIGTHLIGPALIDYLATGRVAESSGNDDPFADFAVNTVIRCRDGEWLALTIVDDDELRRIAGLLGIDASRDAVLTWATASDALEAVEKLQAAGIAAGVIATARHLTEADPQLAHRDWLRTMDSELVGRQTTERYPGRWHRPDGAPEADLDHTASPYLGQHNFEVLRELLGWDEAEVAEALGDELLR